MRRVCFSGMALFNPKTLQNALNASLRAPARVDRDAASAWAARASSVDLDLQNESQLEQEFNYTILQKILGYTAPGTGLPGTMRVKQPIPGGTIVDVALGHFDGAEAAIAAPLELKGPKVQLDRIMPGRNKTPVQQAWDYAMDAPGARWVLLSNMKEVRLYAVGHGRLDYERFDLKKLGDEAELARFQLLLHADNLLGGSTAALLRKSAEADRDITNTLYSGYKSLRTDLLQFVRDQHPRIDGDRRIRIVQTLLDRLLFIAFAEDSYLLPENSLREAINFHDKYRPRPKWESLCKLFEWVDGGASDHDIPPYNGGLFRADAEIDGLDLPDHLVERFLFLSEYDFRSEVSVTILGHIFEQSISDIEAEKAEGQEPSGIAATGKRKREGVVYTPDFVTRFIVEQTIGKHLTEASEELLPRFGKRQADGEIKWRNKTAAEADYWRAYLERLTSLRILDPACGSGAFLIAAFDYLNAEQKRVREQLSELERGILVHASDTADVDIITNNLFGVDVNAESVEITKLALWLKTAKRQRKLESLDRNIKWGNSLVNDAAVHPHPFDWPGEFSEILDGSPDGGFDIVLGNPPYVRMELLKSIKPHLQSRFTVASDRADLYAYFFELGVTLLKPGGRMGYISSSTFFRTGSGKPLRAFLSERTRVETVVDFGDLQVFEGVTTYPAIVVLRKRDHEAASAPSLSYLNVRKMPADLAKSFDDEGLKMPLARLGAETWRFESDLLETIRAKMAGGRPTLAEVLGPPLMGIKSGLKEAFVLTRKQRDAAIARDPRSMELLKPFAVGENLERWHIASDDLWLIYTPRNRVDIDDYPALRDHLAPFRARLEKRAGQQKWWELQQAQAAYSADFQAPKIIYPDITNRNTFSVDSAGTFPENTAYVIPSNSYATCAWLNSSLAWFYFMGLTNIARGGYLRLRTDFVGQLPYLDAHEQEVEEASRSAHKIAAELHELKRATLHRMEDVVAGAASVSTLRDWPLLSFAELQSILQKRCRVAIPVRERDEWEAWFDAQKAKASDLARHIADAEAEIDARVYQAFGLTPTEIAAVEDSLALASPSLDTRSYEAISAVEGLSLSANARAVLDAADGSPRKSKALAA